MIGLTISAAKANFFDRAAVTSAVDRATRQGLSKFGAYVRQRARWSIRKRKAISRPGEPPSSHEGSLRRLIYFAYDRERASVVIGPTLFGNGPSVPALLEYGGEVARRGPRGKRRPVRYLARPYMEPAFRKELPSAPDLLKNKVTK
jgi:hypothetical protein